MADLPYSSLCGCTADRSTDQTTMKLYAISDLHLGHPQNRAALLQLPEYREDWLILAGDVGETVAHLEFALQILTSRFAKILWTPGNHDLWTLPTSGASRGEARYRQMVALCRRYGVLTPEDPYVLWPGANFEALLAPVFVLYDYSFHPDHVAAHDVLAWAEESGVVCADEAVLHPDPYVSRSAWCAARCQYTETRLDQVADGRPLIVVNHYPLRRDLAVLPRIPRFSIWCGTRRTERWLEQYPIALAVYGHLHIRQSLCRDGVRYEEVSLGYPNQWDPARGMAGYLREIDLGTTSHG
jgi:3',5'-cyclic AMP phosphodiesterase CpdA